MSSYGQDPVLILRKCSEFQNLSFYSYEDLVYIHIYNKVNRMTSRIDLSYRDLSMVGPVMSEAISKGSESEDLWAKAEMNSQLSPNAWEESDDSEKIDFFKLLGDCCNLYVEKLEKN